MKEQTKLYEGQVVIVTGGIPEDAFGMDYNIRPIIAKDRDVAEAGVRSLENQYRAASREQDQRAKNGAKPGGS